MHQVLALHLLFVLILNVGLSVSAGYATLARATLGIRPTTTARSRRHAAVHDHRRGGVILHGIEGRRAGRASAGGRLWLWKITVIGQMRSVTRLRRFRIIGYSHLGTTDTGLPRYRAVQQRGLLCEVTARIFQERGTAAVNGRPYLIVVLLLTLLVELVDRTRGRLIEAVTSNVRHAMLALFLHDYLARLGLLSRHFVGPGGRLWNVMMQGWDTIERVAGDVLDRDERRLVRGRS